MRGCFTPHPEVLTHVQIRLARHQRLWAVHLAGPGTVPITAADHLLRARRLRASAQVDQRPVDVCAAVRPRSSTPTACMASSTSVRQLHHLKTSPRLRSRIAAHVAKQIDERHYIVILALRPDGRVRWCRCDSRTSRFGKPSFTRHRSLLPPRAGSGTARHVLTASPSM